MRQTAIKYFIIGLVVIAAQFALPASADDAAIFRQHCSTCHSLNRNGWGPALGNVMGRQAGTREGFRYSAPLRQSNIIWNRSELDIWLQDSRKAVSGTRMNTRIVSQEDRAAIIRYLENPPNPTIARR